MDALYSHSSFVDLIVTGLVGIRPADSADVLVVNPLAADRAFFALDAVRYKGHDIAVAWDRDGTGRYTSKGCTNRLCVWVDGKLTASQGTLGKLSVNLQRPWP